MEEKFEKYSGPFKNPFLNFLAALLTSGLLLGAVVFAYQNFASKDEVDSTDARISRVVIFIKEEDTKLRNEQKEFKEDVRGKLSAIDTKLDKIQSDQAELLREVITRLPARRAVFRSGAL